MASGRAAQTMGPTIAQALARACHGKVALPSKRVAGSVAKLRFQRGVAYKCPVCHKWHISSQRSKRTPRAERG
jgi:hypothetical protein